MNSPVSNSSEQRPPHQFQPGMCANPAGRGKGNVGGRAQALLLLDSLMAEEGNKAKLRDAMQANFNANPMRFFRQIIMPLLPRDVMLKMGEDGAVKWVNLLTTIRTDPNLSSTSIDISDSAPSVAGDVGGRQDSLPPNSST
jgi:hypothetical protein